MDKKNNTSTKFGGRFWVSMLVLGLMGQIAWVVENMYFNVFIYKMFNASASDISAMVMASAVVAAVTTIVMGALSDKIGRRKAFMSFGYILWGVSIIAFAYIKSVTLTIVMDCVMTFFGSTANDAAYNAWLTDRGDSSNRGKIEGINSMMPLISILIVFGGFMSFNLDQHSSWVTIYYIIGAGTVVIGILGLFLIDEKQGLEKAKEPYFSTLIYSFRPSIIKENKTLYISLLAFAIFGISIQVFMPYLIIYYEKSLGLTNYVLIMAPAIIIAAVVTAFFGKLYDKIGYDQSIVFVIITLMAGYVMLYLSKVTAIVFIGSMFMLSGYLMGMSTFGARIRDQIPQGRSGQFQGSRIIGQVLIPGVIGPAIGSYVLKDAQYITNSDGTVSFLPNEKIWAAALAVLIVLALFLALEKRMKRK
jgi:MFS family permease